MAPLLDSPMTRARLALVLLSAVCLAVPLGCGREEPVATVNGERVERAEVESLIDLYKSRAEAREGEAKQKGKEDVSHAQEIGALQVLVQREELAQKARQLGVDVDRDKVEELAERLEGPESRRQKSEGGSDEDEAAVGDQIRATARAQLLYQALQRHVTRNVRIPRSDVIAYYRSHRSSYPTPPARPGNRPPPSIEATIRHGLSSTARDRVMARFVARVHRQFTPKVEYGEGWSPQDAKR